MDLINTFELNQNGGIDDFLQWWDETGISSSVSTPQDQDAINITTIHKSKGLEYKIIFIPKLGWKIKDSKGMLWTSTDVEPLNELPYLPVKNTKKLSQTIFKKDYTNEMLLQYIDNLNLLYVAFTRAKVGIYGYGLRDSNNTDGALVNILQAHTLASDTSIDTSLYWDDEDSTFTFGELPQAEKHKEKNKQQLWLRSYASNQQNSQLKLRLQSHDFTIEDTELLPTASKTGKIWHRIFEQATNIAQLPEAIHQLTIEGVVSVKDTEPLLKNIKSAINNPLIKEWFSPDSIIKTEAAIITPEGYNYRPDRIVETESNITVIDFKFGQQEKTGYTKQVKHYMNLIKQISKKEVNGYVWYVSLNKTKKV